MQSTDNEAMLQTGVSTCLNPYETSRHVPNPNESETLRELVC